MTTGLATWLGGVWANGRQRRHRRRTRTEANILLGSLAAAAHTRPQMTLYTMMSWRLESLHGVYAPEPPPNTDWSRILIPPETEYCVALCYQPGDQAVAMLGDRRGRYSFAAVDLTNGEAMIECWLYPYGDEWYPTFGTFARFHEVFADA